jgi:vanillate O-demethylase monooxygenase subunit
LNAVQQSFADTRTPNIDIAIDAAPLRFRRRIAQLIQQQKPQGMPASG